MSTKKIALCGVFIALGLVLPFLTAQMQEIGNKLLPMHIPVLLCGFICGGPAGLIVGFLTPLLRSALFGMPPMMAAVPMAFELAAYGALAGFTYELLPKKGSYIYLSLIISMIGGRLVWGLASFLMYRVPGNAFTWQMFTAGAFINAIPGIVIQLVIIPILVLALKRSNAFADRQT